MSIDKNRKHLSVYSRAIKDIELTEAAILILERVTGCNSIVRQLKKKQIWQMARIESAEKKLRK